METSTVFVVQPDAGVRESIKMLVRSVGLAAEVFGSAREFLAAFDGSRSGCVVANPNPSDMSGLELQERLNERGESIPFIFVTGTSDVSTAVRAMRAGAVDFIEEPFNPASLLARIQEAVRQDASARAEQIRKTEIRRRLALLTQREREVLGLVVGGHSNKQVAAELHVTEKTVEHHRAHVMRKLQAETVADLVRLAMLSETLLETQ